MYEFLRNHNIFCIQEQMLLLLIFWLCPQTDQNVTSIEGSEKIEW